MAERSSVADRFTPLAPLRRNRHRIGRRRTLKGARPDRDPHLGLLRTLDGDGSYAQRADRGGFWGNEGPELVFGCRVDPPGTSPHATCFATCGYGR